MGVGRRRITRLQLTSRLLVLGLPAVLIVRRRHDAALAIWMKLRISEMIKGV